MSKIEELKGVLTKDQLLDKTRDYDVAESIEIELGDEVRFAIDKEGITSVNHKKGVTTLSPTAVDTLVSHVGFPRPYARRIPKDQVNNLVIPHLNYWYQRELAGKILRLLTINDNAIMAIPGANFKHVKISKVIEEVESVLGKSIAGYHKAWFSPASFQFSILTPEEVKVTERDTYNSGIRIEHSITGQTSTSISPYLFNQWCSNGATTEHKLGSWRRRNNKEDLGTWLQRTIIEARKLFGSEVGKLRGLCGIEVNSGTSKILDSVLEQSSVPRALQKEVRNTLIDDGAKNLYDIYNILTKVDTHSDLFEEHPNSKGILDRVAAHLAHHSELCPTCHRQMN